MKQPVLGIGICSYLFILRVAAGLLSKRSRPAAQRLARLGKAEPDYYLSPHDYTVYYSILSVL
jgi:hypothetical protein